MSAIGKPQACSYFAAAQPFRDGTDTPRAFLEPQVSGFMNEDAALFAAAAAMLPILAP